MSSVWNDFIESEKKKNYFIELEQFLKEEKEENRTIYPPQELRFRAFDLCSFENTKVVIIGQDPYHGENQANGLAFSVPSSQKKLPPSLKNILKELHSDLDCQVVSSGDLSAWASQGVLLINSVLSVEAKKPNSHNNRGWEIFTDSVIKKLSKEREGVVFILWGAFAQKKKSVIDSAKHHIISSVHPSPLSAYRGFFGSKPFSKTNEQLKLQKEKSIEWCLD